MSAMPFRPENEAPCGKSVGLDELDRRIDGGTVRVGGAVLADAVELLERQAVRVEQAVAGRAGGARAMLFEGLLDVLASDRMRPPSSSGTPCGGGAGGSVHSRLIEIHRPRSVGEVRRSSDESARKPPSPKKPTRLSVVNSTRCWRRARRGRHAVELRQRRRRRS